MNNFTNTKRIRPALIGFTLLCSFAAATSVSANTAALWRFEDGAAGSPVPHGERDALVGEDAVVDVSGNGNHLRTWTEDTAPLYITDVPFHPVPQTGEENTLALQFGPGRDVYTDGKSLNTRQFTEWTIEASFKADRVDLYQTIVGKDGNPIGFAPPVFLKVLAHDSRLELGMVDGAGNFLTVVSDDPLVPGEWYDVAGVATEWELTLWIKGPGDADYVMQGFAPTDIEGAFLNNAEGFDRTWSVGRGMWEGNITDWFRGVIDEVRISGSALLPSQFLGTSGSNSGSVHTLAHWRFEEGTAGERVPGPSVGMDAVADLSGNGNDMRTAGAESAPGYVADVPFNPVPQTGQTNNRALSFTPNQDIYTIDKPINSLEFEALSVEASFKANVTEAWQIIVGKDGQPFQPDGVSLHGVPPFMLKTMGGGPEIMGRLEAGLVDSTGAFHSIISTNPLVPGEWYSAAVTASATEMAYYLKGPGDGDYVLQGTRDITGAFTRPDDYASPEDYARSWTVGRGMWAGGIADWFNGTIDEVRISTVALGPSEFLAAGEGGGGEPFDIADLEARAVVVQRVENGEPRDYFGIELWSPEPEAYDLEASADLLDWQAASFISEVVGNENGRTRLRLTTDIPVDMNNKHFLRVRIN